MQLVVYLGHIYCMAAHEVRLAHHSDIPWLIEELRKFSEFYGTKVSLFPGDAIAADKLFQIIKSHVVFVSVRSDERTGFIAGLMSPHFFNEELLVLTEVLWWVPEEFRRTRAGYVLLKRFTEHGKEFADWTIMTTECKSKVSDRTLLSMGYTQYEKSFLLEA